MALGLIASSAPQVSGMAQQVHSTAAFEPCASIYQCRMDLECIGGVDSADKTQMVPITLNYCSHPRGPVRATRTVMLPCPETSYITGFGLPNRRKRVFILASMHGDARDVLLSQVS